MELSLLLVVLLMLSFCFKCYTLIDKDVKHLGMLKVFMPDIDRVTVGA
jgi:hypothetical protein